MRKSKVIENKNVDALIKRIQRYNDKVYSFTDTHFGYYKNDYKELLIKPEGGLNRKTVRGNYTKLKRLHAKRKAEFKDYKLLISYQRTRRRYNEIIDLDRGTVRNNYVLTFKALSGYSKEQKKHLKEFINYTRILTEKQEQPSFPALEKLKFHFNIFTSKVRAKKKSDNQTMDLLSKDGSFYSFTHLTRIKDDIRRSFLNSLSTAEQRYYDNFLKACLRVGAYKLYNEALTRGIGFVKLLEIGGFFIDDVYLTLGYAGKDSSFRVSKSFEDEHISYDDDFNYSYIPVNLRKFPPTSFGRFVYGQAMYRLSEGIERYESHGFFGQVMVSKLVKQSYEENKGRIKNLGRRRERVRRGKK